MSKYGLPYMGSKDKIADEFLEQLPAGKRFVDLFGGGFGNTNSIGVLIFRRYLWIKHLKRDYINLNCM